MHGTQMARRDAAAETEWLKQRLAERAQCVATHDISTRVPHNGFGWTGTRCAQCGFMFFGEWEDWAK